MKYKLYKKHKSITMIITAGIITLLGCFVLGPSVKAVETLIDYPTIEGQDIQLGTNPTSLPGIIKYIYLFSVGICGAVALMAILLGAIKYIGAAGNSSKMGDAKDQIVSAILGVIILLSSYLILNTINPDLVRFSLNTAPLSVDVVNYLNTTGPTYNCRCCCANYVRGVVVPCTTTAPQDFTACLPFPSLSDARLYCGQRCNCGMGQIPQTDVALCSQ